MSEQKSAQFVQPRLLIVLALIICLVFCAPREVLAAAWTERAIGGGYFESIAVSQDGHYMIAGDYEGDVYLSNNYGASWTVTLSDPNGGWTGVAISDDGEVLAATQDGEGVWVSEDGGSTWDETYSDTLPWAGVTMSGDGQHIAAVESHSEEGIFFSDNYGQINSWSQATGEGSYAWSDISYSHDGGLLYALSESNSQIEKTANFGTDWLSIPNIPNTAPWYAVALGNDDIVALAGESVISVSSDGGDAWTDTSATTPTHWNTIAVSDDGETILAGGTNGELSLSTDGGSTWELQSAPGGDSWDGVSVSGDGMYLAAVGASGAWTRSLAVEEEQHASPQQDSGGTVLGLIGSAVPYQGQGSGYVEPRMQTIYPDGHIVYEDQSSSTIPRLSASGTAYQFVRDLALGMVGDDVKELQIFLNTHGFILAASGPGSPGDETTLFGALTKAALIRFQEANSEEILAPLSLSRGTGNFFSSTRSAVHALLAGK